MATVATGEQQQQNPSDDTSSSPPPPSSSSTAGTVVVLLLCGLPASGKSTVAKWLVANYCCQQADVDDVVVSHIEYDQVEDNLREEWQQLQENDNDYNDEHWREIWNTSRAKSLELLRSKLEQLHRPSSSARRHLFIMDDNFHLRSMRREIFRSCQEFVAINIEEEEGLRLCYLGILWLDTPLEVCLERNRARERAVPQDVIERMSTSLDRPGEESFEECYFRVENLPEVTTTAADSSGGAWHRIRQFVTHDITADYNPISPPEPPVDPAILEEERRKTRESWLHTWDQRLRSWVGQVAQISRKDTGAANKARKTLLSKLRGKQCDNKELPSDEQVYAWFVDEMNVKWTPAQMELFRVATLDKLQKEEE